MKTKSVSQNEIKEEWMLIDASGMRVGNLASMVAGLLMGKTDPKVRDYSAPMKKVVIINSSKLDVTPKRGMTKFFKRYSGYPGGLKVEDMDTRLGKNPNFVIEHAVAGMLPKTKKGKSLMSNLRVYVDENHLHTANNPKKVDLNEIKF